MRSIHAFYAKSCVLLLSLAGPGILHAAALTLSITAANHHGYNISCFGGKDGSIDLTVTGGTAPYQYTWSTGATTQDISGLPAGYYTVSVKDAAGTIKTSSITLTEPLAMKPDVDVYKYPNGFNVSCFECYNGNVQVVVGGGATPYTYSWDDGSTAATRANLGPKDYTVTITDANGCTLKAPTVYLQQPERTDWTMSGNAGTDPNNQYIGTPDNKDVVFKTNGAERLRLRSDGRLVLWGGGPQTKGPLYVDSTGVLKRYSDDLQVFGPCATSLNEVYWKSTGNLFVSPLCPGVSNVTKIGPLNSYPLSIITNGHDRMFFETNGNVEMDGRLGIGTVPPDTVSTYRLFVEGGIATRDVFVKTGPWPDYVFTKDYALMPLDELRDYLERWGHLPGMPSAQEVADKQGVEVGDLQARLLKTVEEQALYILQLQEKMQGMEERLEQLEGQHR